MWNLHYNALNIALQCIEDWTDFPISYTISCKLVWNNLESHIHEDFWSQSLCGKNIHTYTICHYNPSVRIVDLVSHTTYVGCVLILYISEGTYSLKSTPNDNRFLEKLFMAILFILRVFCQKSAERKLPKK